MDKILLIHASFGEGHKQAALALEKYLDTPCLDLLDFCHPFVKKFYSNSYIKVANYCPWFWKFLFFLTTKSEIISLVNVFNRFVFSSFLSYIKKTGTKIIVSTHFFPIALAALLKKELGLKLVTIVTDFRVHPLWINDQVDLYIASIKDTKDDLIKLGIEDKKIIFGYAPLREGFLKNTAASELRSKLNLDLRPCLLFMSSVAGRFPFLKELLPALNEKYNIFIICGKNKKLKKYLDEMKFSSVRYFTFYENIWDLFDISLCVISKPGGLTIFEGIYKKKTFIFTHYIPGQEEENMKLLASVGIGRFIKDKDKLYEALDYFSQKQNDLNNNYPIKLIDIKTILKQEIEKLY